MKLPTILTALLLAATPAFGMSQKPKVTVRFHAEANPQDGSSFTRPAKLLYQKRAAVLQTVPALSERQIKAIYPFKTTDGSWGCFFQFNDQGRMRLETMSTEQRNTALVLFVGTKGGQHQVVDMLIDRPVTTGQITVPRGLTDVEVLVLKQQFKVIGEETPKEKKQREKSAQQVKKDEDTDWGLDRTRDAQRSQAVPSGPPGPPVAPPSTPPSRRQLHDLDLPRLSD